MRYRNDDCKIMILYDHLEQDSSHTFVAEELQILQSQRYSFRYFPWRTSSTINFVIQFSFTYWKERWWWWWCIDDFDLFFHLFFFFPFCLLIRKQPPDDVRSFCCWMVVGGGLSQQHRTTKILFACCLPPNKQPTTLSKIIVCPSDDALPSQCCRRTRLAPFF